MMDTSLDAYQDIKSELGYRQKVVLDVIKYLGNPTNTEISKFLGLPINQITPRTNELVNKLHLVKEAGKKECKVTGRIVMSWRSLL